jgi:triacylglycerol lipase
MSNTKEPFIGTKFSTATMCELSVFSTLAYKDEECVEEFLASKGFYYVKYIEDKATSTQGYVAASDDNIVIFFRGTRGKKDIQTDIKIAKVPAPSWKKADEVHKGFWTSYESIREVLATTILFLLKNRKRKVWVTGHSLGAAISGIAAFDLQRSNIEIKIEGSYLFGQPRFCNKAFSKTYNKELKSVTFRFVNNNDLVTRIPLNIMGYFHTGTLYYFDSNKKLKKQITWWFNLMDRFRGKFRDAFDGDIDSIADHSMPLYAKLCLINI